MDFYFGVLDPHTPIRLYNYGYFEIVVGTPSTAATYAIESSDGEIASGTVTSSSPCIVRIHMSDDFIVTSSAFSNRMKGVRAYATGHNTIYVLVFIYTISSNTFPISGYSLLQVHPNHKNIGVDEYVYNAISTYYSGAIDFKNTDRKSTILLVGNHNETNITITPTQAVSLPFDAQSDSTLVLVAAGTSHTVTLNTLQTLRFSSLLDLTGTKIVSNKPLTVITGNQCGLVRCTPPYVHLPPTFNWGQLFLLAPLAGYTGNQQYKCVTTEDSTTIAYRCGTQTSEGLVIATAGSGQLLSIPTHSYCYLTASNPIFVVQMAPLTAADNGIRRYTDMAIVVPPTSAHVTSTSFFYIYTDIYITVTVQAQHFIAYEILLDGEMLGCTWNNIYNIVNDDIVGYGCTFAVSEGPHTIFHSGGNGTLSVMTYGRKSGSSYGYLTNFNFELPVQTTDGKYLVVQ